MSYRCPICGYPKLRERPRTRGGGGSFEICPSCGFQFGVTDDDRGISYGEWRVKWRANGMKWSSQQTPPTGWDPARQLQKLEREANPNLPRR